MQATDAPCREGQRPPFTSTHFSSLPPPPLSDLVPFDSFHCGRTIRPGNCTPPFLEERHGHPTHLISDCTTIVYRGKLEELSFLIQHNLEICSNITPQVSSACLQSGEGSAVTSARALSGVAFSWPSFRRQNVLQNCRGLK